jgi:hypothetical protein
MLKSISNTLILALYSTMALVAHAQGSGAASYYTNPIVLQGADGGPIKTIPEFLLALVDIVFLFGMPIVVLFIIYGGFLFVTAGDNEAQITKAKKTILWTLIGAAVLIGAKVIAAAIQATVLSLK